MRVWLWYFAFHKNLLRVWLSQTSMHSFCPAKFREVNSGNQGLCFGDTFPNVYKYLDIVVTTWTLDRSVPYIDKVIKFRAEDS